VAPPLASRNGWGGHGEACRAATVGVDGSGGGLGAARPGRGTSRASLWRKAGVRGRQAVFGNGAVVGEADSRGRGAGHGGSAWAVGLPPRAPAAAAGARRGVTPARTKGRMISARGRSVRAKEKPLQWWIVVGEDRSGGACRHQASGRGSQRWLGAGVGPWENNCSPAVAPLNRLRSVPSRRGWRAGRHPLRASRAGCTSAVAEGPAGMEGRESGLIQGRLVFSASLILEISIAQRRRSRCSMFITWSLGQWK